MKWTKRGVSMADQIFLYIGSTLPFIWGIAHLFPTKSVVQEFGDISPDNKRIITMEWIIEGISLIFIGVLVCAVTMVDPTSAVSTVVYAISICCLLVLALVSLFTGFRISFLPFRLCPFIFTASAVLIFIGGLL
jgi:predicted RND superfamily exporter protein